METLLEPFVGELRIEHHVDLSLGRYVVCSFSFAMKSENRHDYIDGHEDDEQGRENLHETVSEINVVEDLLYQRKGSANPEKAERTPHHPEDEVGSAVDGAESAGVIPGYGVPEGFHTPACSVFEDGAQHHSDKEDDQIMGVVEAVENERQDDRPHAVDGREGSPDQAGPAFPFAVDDDVKHIFHQQADERTDDEYPEEHEEIDIEILGSNLSPNTFDELRFGH